MGGTCFGRGNTTPAAEFNVLADAEAASVVLPAGLPTELVPWEVCLENPISGAEIDRDLAAAPPGPIADLVRGLAASGRALRERFGGGDEFVLPDPLAVAVYLDRSVVARSVSASVAVELAGTLTRGMTVVDPSGRLGAPPIEVVEAVHPHALDGFFGRILAPAPGE
jgi:purine nucleosidase/non-specific riboncleoside hydrolase